MAKQILQVGTHNNDKTGDTLRAGGLKIKANFDEIYGALAADGMTITGGNLLKSGSWNDIRNKPDFKLISTTASFNDLLDKPALVTATAKPDTLLGYQGQQAGEIAFDGNNLYVSVADYDGTTLIWKYVPWGGGGTSQGYTYSHNQNPSIQGGFSLDHNDPSQATVMYISTHDVNGNNIHAFYQYIFDQGLSFLLEVINRTNPDNRAVFSVSGSREMTANNEEYYELDISYVMSTNEVQIDSGMWDLHFDFTGSGTSRKTTTGDITLTNDGVLDSQYASGEYTFVHAGYSNDTDVIDTDVALTRGTQLGLYNPLTDNAYNNGDTGNLEWNNEGWGDLSNVTTRSYTNWVTAVDNYPPRSVNAELVIHDTLHNKYYTIKFLSWQTAGQGGGFSYVRRLINTTHSIVFNKEDNGSQVDYIDTNVAITRNNGQEGPYNPLVEEGWDHTVSPVNTLWNKQGWDDLSNVTTRSYTTFDSVGNGNPIEWIANTELVMKDTVNNKYYKIKFSKYNGNGSGITYTREEINLINPNSGILFDDGTSLKTGRVNDIPQHIADNNTSYYVKREDAGKHIYVKSGGTVYVPPNSAVSFPIGTTIVIVSGDLNTYIYRDDGNTTIWGASLNNSSGSFYIPPRSMATLLKIEEDGWMLSGAGLGID
jgi:hypothetical protein